MQCKICHCEMIVFKDYNQEWKTPLERKQEQKMAGKLDIHHEALDFLFSPTSTSSASRPSRKSLHRVPRIKRKSPPRYIRPNIPSPESQWDNAMSSRPSVIQVPVQSEVGHQEIITVTTPKGNFYFVYIVMVAKSGKAYLHLPNKNSTDDEDDK